MHQSTLFDTTDPQLLNCAVGRHAALYDAPPIMRQRDADVYSGCVNVSHICPLCGLTVSETSYTLEAWTEYCTKPKRR